MIDLNLLNERIKSSGMTMVAIAEKSGILRETLYNKLKGVADFRSTEILNLSDAIGLTPSEREEIFFKKNSE